MFDKVQTAFCNKERFLLFNQGLPQAGVQHLSVLIADYKLSLALVD
jgi:hypothetical protein